MITTGIVQTWERDDLLDQQHGKQYKVNDCPNPPNLIRRTKPRLISIICSKINHLADTKCQKDGWRHIKTCCTVCKIIGIRPVQPVYTHHYKPQSTSYIKPYQGIGFRNHINEFLPIKRRQRPPLINFLLHRCKLYILFRDIASLPVIRNFSPSILYGIDIYRFPIFQPPKLAVGFARPCSYQQSCFCINYILSLSVCKKRN